MAGVTITMISNHVEKKITQNKRVKGKLNKIKKRILNILDATPLFSNKSVSNKEIDNVVMSHFQKLGSPKDIGQKAHEEKFIEMLNELGQ